MYRKWQLSYMTSYELMPCTTVQSLKARHRVGNGKGGDL